MARCPRPPIPPAIRRRARRELFLTSVLAAGMAPVAFVAWRATGDPEALWVLAPVLLLAAAIASHRIGVLHVLLFVLASTSAGWLFDRPDIGLAAGVAAAVYAVVRSRRLPVDFTSDTIVEGPADTVPRDAEDSVAGFNALGYRQVGVITSRMNGREVIASIMAGPGHDRYATVTEAATSVTSTFGSRSLVTRNSALSRMPPDMLDNPVWGASPSELDLSHGAALSQIARHASPDVLDPALITSRALREERRCVDWVRGRRTHLQTGGGKGRGPLNAHPAADDLILEWLSV